MKIEACKKILANSLVTRGPRFKFFAIQLFCTRRVDHRLLQRPEHRSTVGAGAGVGLGVGLGVGVGVSWQPCVPLTLWGGFRRGPPGGRSERPRHQLSGRGPEAVLQGSREPPVPQRAVPRIHLHNQ